MSDLPLYDMDKNLERAIDRAGREQVFTRAYEYGWGPYDLPPKWVWYGIVAEILEEQPGEQND